MSRRIKKLPQELPEKLVEKAKAPLGILLGSPGRAIHLFDALQIPETVFYQMDLYPAGRLREELGENAAIETRADLWDLEETFQTLIYLPQRAGERELKIDIVEQAFHILRPRGRLMVWSPYRSDDLFPSLLKKIYGKVSAFHGKDDTLLIAQREKERPKRRHELTFQAKIGEGESCRFLSRPGVFSYGRMDFGSRALMETVDLKPGQTVLDMGCGCGTNGIFAAQQVGKDAPITFVDSNVRAVELARMNAEANGLSNFEAVASADVSGMSQKSFDVILCNPPYFAHDAIAGMFAERARELLAPEGQFHVVTKQPHEMGVILTEVFGACELRESRGYAIFSAPS